MKSYCSLTQIKNFSSVTRYKRYHLLLVNETYKQSVVVAVIGTIVISKFKKANVILVHAFYSFIGLTVLKNGFKLYKMTIAFVPILCYLQIQFNKI